MSLVKKIVTWARIKSPWILHFNTGACNACDIEIVAALTPRFVQGESIGQTYSFVASGNAELGFVALSQVYENGKVSHGSGWIVPASLHDALRQDAVLLARSRDKPAARALLAFLKTEKARGLIRTFGYETP